MFWEENLHSSSPSHPRIWKNIFKLEYNRRIDNQFAAVFQVKALIPLVFVCDMLFNLIKNRDITLLTKVQIVKAMVSPVVMHGCESWTIKKVECQRIYAFELCCWRRLLRVLWTKRRSNQSIIKAINPEYSLEGLMLELKQIWPPDAKGWHWKRPWCWERSKAKGEGGGMRWDGWIA